jgi:hypothetical protein
MLQYEATSPWAADRAGAALAVMPLAVVYTTPACMGSASLFTLFPAEHKTFSIPLKAGVHVCVRAHACEFETPPVPLDI